MKVIAVTNVGSNTKMMMIAENIVAINQMADHTEIHTVGGMYFKCKESMIEVATQLKDD